LEIELFDILAYLAAKAVGLVVQMAPNDENSALEHPVRLDPQEIFRKRDKTRNV
jgi:hypothetical protein